VKVPRRRDGNRSPGRAGLPRRTPAKSQAEAVARSKPKRKTSFTGRAAVLAVVLAALAIALAGPLRQLISQRSQISSLRGDVNAQTEQLKNLQEQQKQWSDPAYVQKQARDRLHYVMPGEVPYVTLSPTPSPSASGGASKPVGDQPWYAQLWSSVQGADATPAAPSARPSPTPAP
jgi:cell division protein FtsB